MKLEFAKFRLCGHVTGRENTFEEVRSFLESLLKPLTGGNTTIIMDDKNDVTLGDDECVIVVTPDCVDLETYRRMRQAKMQNQGILYWDGKQLNDWGFVKFYDFKIVDTEQASWLNPSAYSPYPRMVFGSELNPMCDPYYSPLWVDPLQLYSVGANWYKKTDL